MAGLEEFPVLVTARRLPHGGFFADETGNKFRDFMDYKTIYQAECEHDARPMALLDYLGRGFHVKGICIDYAGT